MLSLWVRQNSSKVSVVLLASSTEKPCEISVSSPGIKVSTNPLANMRIYLRASAWFANGETNPLRSLLGWLVSINSGKC